MTPARWERVKDVFAEALSLSAADRPLFLNGACASETALRAEVERLLSAFVDGENLIETAAIPIPATHTFTPGETLCNRYRVIGFLGQGGMGEVYEADDVDLHERIALKTLRLPNISDKRSIGRFRQEIQLARKVTHPNVCRIFDMGSHGGITFLTMELLKGETLFAYLKREHKCSAAHCLPLARQMAAALDAAHQAGIVHRDFKPANVMLVGGGPRVVVMDFGVAHSLATPAPDQTATATGHLAGTPAYMAPEQFLGEPATAAADIYAFGIVLHEMLTGNRPVSTGSLNAAQDHRQAARPLNPRCERAIQRCLDPDPARRFKSAREAVDAIESRAKLSASRAVAAVSISVLALTITASGALAFIPAVRDRAVDWIAAKRLPQEKNLAILPFVNIGSDPGNQPFCDGLLEVATSTLTQVSPSGGALKIVPSSEVRRGSVKSAEDAYRLFNANLVITGSIQRNGNQVRVTANLVDARSKRQLRSQTLNFDSKESIPLQEAVVARLTDLLNVELASSSQQVLARAGTAVPAANELYLKGVGYLQRYDQPGNLDRAISALDQSVQQDTAFVLARVRLSEAYVRKYQNSKDGDFLDKAREQSLIASQADKANPVTHVATGMVLSESGDNAGALAEFQESLRLDPEYAVAARELAGSFEKLGRMKEAEAAFRKAADLREGGWSAITRLGVFYNNRARYPEAAECFKKVINLTPNNPIAHRDLAGAYTLLGQFPEAEGEYRRSIDLAPNSSAYSSLGTLFIYQARYREAIPMLEKSVALLPKTHAKAYIVWANLGDAYRYTPEFAMKALPAYQHAIEETERILLREPNNVDLLSRRAVYLSKSGNRKIALDQVEKVLHLNRTDAGVLFRAGLTYYICGNLQRARSLFVSAVRAGFSQWEIDREPELKFGKSK